MDNKLSELKAAAMAATPGPWFRSSVQFNGITTEETFITQGNKPHVASTSEKRDAIFIAAANPAAVLELLADNEHLARELVARNGENEWLRKRSAELEAIRADASQVFREIGNELGCNPDNESIMMAIDDLKEREKRVVALAGGNAELWETMAARLEAAEAKLEAKDKCIAEAEVRGVEKLAAAFKSWASDETFPDCEAQRHWATASQEALSFAGDLLNGSCDDR
ncbi:hypothetical protein SME04J_04500 [Serratia marcescens]|nr:hypothetical protein SME04J_04500 [Serratia marcescens]